MPSRPAKGKQGGTRRQASAPAQPGTAEDSPGPGAAPAVPAAAVFRSPEGKSTLTKAEQAALAAREADVDHMRKAFIAGARALKEIQEGRLYRDQYGTFEDYVTQRWDMSRQQAYRLIAAVPLLDALSPAGDKINERQVRELLPVANLHGQEAAVTVYEAVAGTDGVQVTSDVLHGAAGIACAIPAGSFDAGEATRQIRAYLAAESTPETQKKQEPWQPDPVRVFSDIGKILSGLRSGVNKAAVRAARKADPELVRRTVADIRALADEIERDAAG
jgi:ribosomal protein L12E/L44/L45/RPP1/RPP2